MKMPAMRFMVRIEVFERVGAEEQSRVAHALAETARQAFANLGVCRDDISVAYGDELSAALENGGPVLFIPFAGAVRKKGD